jgi:hypothetical protein
MTGDLDGAREFFPTVNTLYASGQRGVVEVNAALTTVRNVAVSSTLRLGTFGDDVVHFETVRLDEALMTAGRIDLIREDAWRKQIAVDSDVRLDNLCEDVPTGDAR